ncbi:uncharacterized protein N0V89_004856 [Didymosphaeria variabile]|uniref:TPR-like protein n=1 Tax=Didymosphaeria variabile TaxID=1932322 RepID=A0A9W8XR25_9PLEO|nr:uncharacterized protein N0V89_004856 [Didymosphaeria variabile]KAJ4356819.1 hypothetical protein N0V89_004856 [Didymosphaeria variabile]
MEAQRNRQEIYQPSRGPPHARSVFSYSGGKTESVNSHSYTLSRYLKSFLESDEKRVSLLNRKVPKDRRDPAVPPGVIITWQMSFDLIRETDPKAADLLSLMAMFDNQEIPGLLVHEGQSYDEFWVVASPLTNFSLIKVQDTDQPNPEVDEMLFDMHGLVQLATRDWLRIEGKLKEWEGKSIHTMFTRFPYAKVNDRKSWKTCEILLPHAQKTLAYIPEDKSVTFERMKVAWEVGLYLRVIGDYSEAEQISSEVYLEAYNLLGPKSLDTISSSELLADVYIYQGKYNKAQALQEKALEVLQEEFPQGHIHTFNVYARLGTIYIYQSKYAKAETHLRKALEGYSLLADPDIVQTYWTQGELAVSLDKQGKLQEAEDMHLQVIERMKQSAGPEATDTITCMFNLAQLFSQQKQFTKAIQWHRQCAKAYKAILGAEHPLTLLADGQVGLNLWYDGQTPEAAEILRHNLEMTEQRLGAEHKSTFTRANNLALVLADQMNYTEAETLFIRAIKGMAGIHRMDHPHLNTSMLNYSDFLVKQGLHQEAAKLKSALKDPNMLSNVDEFCSLLDRLHLDGDSRDSDGTR